MLQVGWSPHQQDLPVKNVGKSLVYSKTAGGILEKNTLEEFRKIVLTAARSFQEETCSGISVSVQ